jgi:O-antigen/teichoic acid export membrane protein
MSDKTVGLLIGAAFSLGCLICVLAQHRFARRMTMGYRLEMPTRRGTLRYLTDGGFYCLGELPNQLYVRALLVLVNENADTKTTGIYIYIRQVMSAIAQGLAVIKRLEFIKLSVMVSEDRITFPNILQSQALNISAAILYFLGAIVFANLHVSLPSSRGAAVDSGFLTFYLACFAAAVPVWAVSAAFGQIVILLNQMRMYSLIMLITVGLSATGSVLLMPRFGLAALAVIDSSMLVIQATMFWLVVQRFRRRLP